jgi:hypothetical protein
MEKTVIGLVAALGAAAPLAGAHAAVATSDEANQALQSRTIAELLDAAPANAVAILNKLDSEGSSATSKSETKGVLLAWHHHHHHHHWHHHYYHHHHHYYHHHHHWHHHHHFFGFGWCMTHPWEC